MPNLVSSDGKLTPVESVTFTGKIKPVYNLRVSQDHTYFVGSTDWGFSVWVHNTYKVDDLGNVTNELGELVGRITKNADGTVVYKSKINPGKEYYYKTLQEAKVDAGKDFLKGEAQWNKNGFPNVANTGKLVFDPSTRSWTSPAGLIYGQGSKHEVKLKVQIKGVRNL